jgi:hypothetical protein
MGDGSLQNKGLHLSVYAFSQSDVTFLIKALTINFSVKCTLHNHVKGLRIYLDQASINSLRPLLLPLMVPSMHYKLGL